MVLFFILIVLYLQKIGERKKGAGAGSYLGTQLHIASMSETIEDVARKVIIANPGLEDNEQVRMVRDELRLVRRRSGYRFLREFGWRPRHSAVLHGRVDGRPPPAAPPPPPLSQRSS
jgi:hypothetical protein